MDITIDQMVRQLREARNPTPRPLTRLEWILLAVTTAALFAVSVSILGAVYHVHVGFAFGISALSSAGLLLAPVRPRLAILLHFAGTALFPFPYAIYAEAWPLPVPQLISLSLLLAIIVLRETLTLAIVTWLLNLVAPAVALILLGFAAMQVGGNIIQESSSLIAISIYTGLIVAAGYNLSRRNWSKHELVQAKRTAEIEQERRMGAEERSRIAREMHDVVAHSMSIVHMQASSAPFRVADLNDEAKAEFESIAESARDALKEMRTLLGVLRLDEYSALTPQPQLTDLQALVEGSRNGGIEAALHLDTDRDPRELPDTVQLTAYRVVQEALSNVIRHAPGTSAEVSVMLLGPELTVRITNTAPPASTDPRDGEESDSTGSGTDLASGGVGILGMRERVTTLGGHLTARPQSFGGYVVEARLPVTDSAHSAPEPEHA
ncbi:sensor histidine kinase [Pseudoclavibacter sp. AY1F1]|uniref:sensor histidine kinase n=1 Tax=Pseudoclavibacter sp. AY1F1 TaxID=2080583 RepID=UPI0011B08E30|nr:histidine kinase [Pseudoclavibacter sp. AY1F1]